jgi:hypothetical protein
MVDVATGDQSRPAVAAEAGRLVGDALASALLDLAEALRAPPGEPRPAGAPAPDARQADGGSGLGAGASRVLAGPSRAAADAASAIAALLVPAIVERIDVNALLSKVDVDALVARIHVNRLLDGVDVEQLIDRVDVDQIVRRVDMAAVAREALEGIDFGNLIQESTASIGAETVEAVRLQAMHADELVARFVDRLLGRRRPRDTALRERGAG